MDMLPLNCRRHHLPLFSRCAAADNAPCSAASLQISSLAATPRSAAHSDCSTAVLGAAWVEDACSSAVRWAAAPQPANRRALGNALRNATWFSQAYVMCVSCSHDICCTMHVYYKGQQRTGMLVRWHRQRW